jgi:cytochrome c oxidase subunit 2
MRAPVYVVEPSIFQRFLVALKTNAPPPVGTPPPKAAQPGVPGSAGSVAKAATGSSSATSPSSSGSTSTAAAAAGKAVFTGASGCSGCHTLADAGASGTVGPNLDVRLRTDCSMAASKRIRGATLTQCIHTAIVNPYAYIPSGYTKGIMPPTFGKSLTPTQIQSLVSYLASVAK